MFSLAKKNRRKKKLIMRAFAVQLTVNQKYFKGKVELMKLGMSVTLTPESYSRGATVFSKHFTYINLLKPQE